MELTNSILIQWIFHYFLAFFYPVWSQIFLPHVLCPKLLYVVRHYKKIYMSDLSGFKPQPILKLKQVYHSVLPIPKLNFPCCIIRYHWNITRSNKYCNVYYLSEGDQVIRFSLSQALEILMNLKSIYNTNKIFDIYKKLK